MQQVTLPTITSLPGIGLALRNQLVAQLNGSLASLTDLATAYKQAHWNVVGLQFAQLHELFDEFASQTREYADLVAERAVTLGGIANGTLQAAVEHTSLPPFPQMERDPVRLLEALALDVDRLTSNLRDGIASTADEPATQDLYVEVTRGIEKQRWMLLAHVSGAATGR